MPRFRWVKVRLLLLLLHTRKRSKLSLGIGDCEHLIKPARRFAPVGFFVGL